MTHNLTTKTRTKQQAEMGIALKRFAKEAIREIIADIPESDVAGILKRNLQSIIELLDGSDKYDRERFKVSNSSVQTYYKAICEQHGVEPLPDAPPTLIICPVEGLDA